MPSISMVESGLYPYENERAELASDQNGTAAAKRFNHALSMAFDRPLVKCA